MVRPGGRPRGWRQRPLPEAKPAQSAVGGGKSPYRLGRDFERAVRGRLERRDYFVMRAHGSKGKVDLLAVHKTNPTLFIQAKRRGQISSTEWNEVFELGVRYGAWPVVVTKLSERTVGFFRLDAARIPRKPGRPWTQFDPADCSLIIPPPTLL